MLLVNNDNPFSWGLKTCFFFKKAQPNGFYWVMGFTGLVFAGFSYINGDHKKLNKYGW